LSFGRSLFPLDPCRVTCSGMLISVNHVRKAMMVLLLIRLESMAGDGGVVSPSLDSPSFFRPDNIVEPVNEFCELCTVSTFLFLFFCISFEPIGPPPAQNPLCSSCSSSAFSVSPKCAQCSLSWFFGMRPVFFCVRRLRLLRIYPTSYSISHSKLCSLTSSLRSYRNFHGLSYQRLLNASFSSSSLVAQCHSVYSRLLIWNDVIKCACVRLPPVPLLSLS